MDRAKRQKILQRGRPTVHHPDRGAAYWKMRDEQEAAQMEEDASSGSDTSPLPTEAANKRSRADSTPLLDGGISTVAAGGEATRVLQLEEKLRKLTDSHDELRTKEGDLSAQYSDLLQRFRTANDDHLKQLKDRDEEVQRVLQERDDERERAEKQQDRADSLDSDRRRIQRLFDELQRKHDDTDRELEFEKEKNRTMLEERNAMLKQGIDAERFAELERRRVNMEKEVAMFRQQAADGRSREEMLERDLQAARAEAARAQDQLRQLVRERGSDANLRQVLAESRRGEERLNSELSAVRAEDARLREKLREVELHRDELRRTRRTGDADGGGDDHMKSELAKRHEENQHLRRQERELRKEVNEAQVRARRTEKAAERANRRIAEMVDKSEYRALENRLRDKEDELDQCRQARSGVSAADMSAKLRQANLETEKLRTRMVELEKQKERWDEKHIQKQIKEKNDELQRLREQIRQLQEQNQESQSKITELLRSNK